MSEHEQTYTHETTYSDEDVRELREIVTPTSTASSSVLDALRTERARVAHEQTYDLIVPGWRSLLVLRLGAISAQQQQRIVERVQRRKLGASADVDFLIASFREVLGRATPTGELAVLVDEDGVPVGLDERLADMLGLGVVRSAREVVDRLFEKANSPTMALSSEMAEWLDWARSASDEADESFLGE